MCDVLGEDYDRRVGRVGGEKADRQPHATMEKIENGEREEGRGWEENKKWKVEY